MFVQGPSHQTQATITNRTNYMTYHNTNFQHLQIKTHHYLHTATLHKPSHIYTTHCIFTPTGPYLHKILFLFTQNHHKYTNHSPHSYQSCITYFTQV